MLACVGLCWPLLACDWVAAWLVGQPLVRRPGWLPMQSLIFQKSVVEISDSNYPSTPHCEPGNRFRFRFAFAACVRASKRGEAAWAREGCASSTLGFKVENSTAPHGHFSSKSYCSPCGFEAISAQVFSRRARRLVCVCIGFGFVFEGDSSRIYRCMFGF